MCSNVFFGLNDAQVLTQGVLADTLVCSEVRPGHLGTHCIFTGSQPDLLVGINLATWCFFTWSPGGFFLLGHLVDGEAGVQAVALHLLLRVVAQRS